MVASISKAEKTAYYYFSTLIAIIHLTTEKFKPNHNGTEVRYTMKALFLNGSPRNNFNTAQMLQTAMDGAREAGAETELISLFDYEFT